MTDAERAYVANLQRDIILAEKRIKALEAKVNQHTTVLNNLSMQHEAMRHGVFGDDGLTAH